MLTQIKRHHSVIAAALNGLAAPLEKAVMLSFFLQALLPPRKRFAQLDEQGLCVAIVTVHRAPQQGRFIALKADQSVTLGQRLTQHSCALQPHGKNTVWRLRFS